MTEKKSPVPDFSTWKLIRRQSIFLTPGKTVFDERELAEDDGAQPFWCGYFCKYSDPTGNAVGREYDLFGHGLVFKCWGLTQEEYYSGYAVLRGKDWEYFPRKTHIVGIVASMLYHKQKPISVPLCKVRVLLRDTEREILSITVQRDLLALPPINPHTTT